MLGVPPRARAEGSVITFRNRGMREALGDPPVFARRLANDPPAEGAAPLMVMEEPAAPFRREAS